MATLSQIPRILPSFYKISSCLSLVIPQKLTLMLQSASFPPPEINHPFTDDMLDFEVSDIIKAIEDIKPNAAPGPDDIPVMLLKNCKDAVTEPTHLIWKMCFSAEEVPSLYKFSHVVPLYKKDSRAMPTNYRPISFTSHVIKIFERVIRKKMVDYLEKNELICNRQHGFRAGWSCLTQLLHCFDDVLKSITNNSDFDQSLMSLQCRHERFIILHMWTLLNNITSNDLNIKFVTCPRFGNLAIIPYAQKDSTAANQSLFDNSFAVKGPKLWNAIPYHLNVIQDLQQFKDRLTKFMLSLPDKPSIRAYAAPNSNSLL